MYSVDDVENLCDILNTLSYNPYLFVQTMFEWDKGILKGQQIEEWQKDILLIIKDWLINPSEPLRIAVTSGHGIGKSALVSWIILWALSTMTDTRGVVTANTETQLLTKTWAELQKWHNLSFIKDFFQWQATSISTKEKDKVKSWRKFNLTFKYNICKSGTDKVVDGIMSRYVWEDYYMLSFLHDYANRPSCFDCQFRNGKCQSDLTLADFWSIEKLTDNIELKSDKGTSLIMVHSHKGNKLIGETSCILSPFAFKESFRGNPAVFYNWPKPISHDLFFRECKKSDIKCAYEKAHRLRIVFDSVKKKKNIIVKIIRKVWQK